MEFDSLNRQAKELIHVASSLFQRVPGSAVLIRYIRSSYQNDPVRSAIELILVLFFIRYLLSPSYSTHKQNFVKLKEEVWALVCYLYRSYANIIKEIEELVDDWTPESLVPEPTPLEEIENEKLPTIVGYVDTSRVEVL